MQFNSTNSAKSSDQEMNDLSTKILKGFKAALLERNPLAIAKLHTAMNAMRSQPGFNQFQTMPAGMLPANYGMLINAALAFWWQGMAKEKLVKILEKINEADPFIKMNLEGIVIRNDSPTGLAGYQNERRLLGLVNNSFSGQWAPDFVTTLDMTPSEFIAFTGHTYLSTLDGKPSFYNRALHTVPFMTEEISEKCNAYGDAGLSRLLAVLGDDDTFYATLYEGCSVLSRAVASAELGEMSMFIKTIVPKQVTFAVDEVSEGSKQMGIIIPASATFTDGADEVLVAINRGVLTDEMISQQYGAAVVGTIYNSPTFGGMGLQMPCGQMPAQGMNIGMPIQPHAQGYMHGGYGNYGRHNGESADEGTGF